MQCSYNIHLNTTAAPRDSTTTPGSPSSPRSPKMALPKNFSPWSIFFPMILWNKKILEPSLNTSFRWHYMSVCSHKCKSDNIIMLQIIKLQCKCTEGFESVRTQLHKHRQKREKALHVVQSLFYNILTWIHLGWQVVESDRETEILHVLNPPFELVLDTKFFGQVVISLKLYYSITKTIKRQAWRGNSVVQIHRLCLSFLMVYKIWRL